MLSMSKQSEHFVLAELFLYFMTRNWQSTRFAQSMTEMIDLSDSLFFYWSGSRQEKENCQKVSKFI